VRHKGALQNFIGLGVTTIPMSFAYGGGGSQEDIMLAGGARKTFFEKLYRGSVPQNWRRRKKRTPRKVVHGGLVMR